MPADYRPLLARDDQFDRICAILGAVAEQGSLRKATEVLGNCYYFFGTKGSLAFPSFTMYSYEEENYGWEHELITEKFNVENNDPMTAELLHFIDVLRGEAEPLVTGEDGLETLKVINAIIESAEKRQKIDIH